MNTSATTWNDVFAQQNHVICHAIVSWHLYTLQQPTWPSHAFEVLWLLIAQKEKGREQHMMVSLVRKVCKWEGGGKNGQLSILAKCKGGSYHSVICHHWCIIAEIWYKNGGLVFLCITNGFFGLITGVSWVYLWYSFWTPDQCCITDQAVDHCVSRPLPLIK